MSAVDWVEWAEHEFSSKLSHYTLQRRLVSLSWEEAGFSTARTKAMSMDKHSQMLMILLSVQCLESVDLQIDQLKCVVLSLFSVAGERLSACPMTAEQSECKTCSVIRCLAWDRLMVVLVGEQKPGLKSSRICRFQRTVRSAGSQPWVEAHLPILCNLSHLGQPDRTRCLVARSWKSWQFTAKSSWLLLCHHAVMSLKQRCTAEGISCECSL